VPEAGTAMKEFRLCIVPEFVAANAVGVLPPFQSLSRGMVPRQVRQAIYLSTAVALAFFALRTATLDLLGITVADFMVAGGILLLVLALGALMAKEKLQRRMEADSLGAVPLSVPLITGSAVPVTSMLRAAIAVMMVREEIEAFIAANATACPRRETHVFH